MFQMKSILGLIIAVLAVFCFALTADAAKGGGGCKDRDGDGFFQKADCGSTVDCDDTNAAVNPNAVEVCDDGVDNNCDGTVDEGCGGCTDNDGDGYGSGPDCLGPDCDDNDEAINPGAAEVCDSIDNNCDGTVDEGCGGCTDNDGDGYGNGSECLGPDCDDNDPSINPGAAEICDDNIDNNCDSIVDENCSGCVPTASKERDCDCFDNTDNDCDGSTDSLDKDCRNETCDTCFDNDGDGWYDCGGDCDDTDPAINPGSPEICNGIDDNCDNTLPVEEQDIDADGVSICEGDCDDNDPNRSPNNAEEPFGHPVCTDGIDNDCDDLIDAGDPGCDVPCIDNDNDGFGINGDPSCQYPGIIDCDDTDPTINPLAEDFCDGIDRNCDGQTINDDDNDGFGVPASPYCTYNIEDCDDTDPTINPLAEDFCDGIDRNCDGQTINDDDNDGFGVPASPYCTYNIEDCDDTDPTINPLAEDFCDGIDRNCDGQAINDDDGDGFGVPASPYCMYNVEDCDDTDPAVNPFALEGPYGDPTCSDTKDNDCDGSTDAADPDCASPFCTDNADCTGGTDYCEKTIGNCGGQGSCQPRPENCPTVWAPVCGCDGITYSNSCSAAQAGVNVDYDGECNACGGPPGDDSNCNGLDEDCDGVPDDDYVPRTLPCLIPPCPTCQCVNGTEICDPPPCDPEGPQGDPTCSDLIDNDCDGLTDAQDPDCAAPCPDNDGDGSTTCDGDCDDTDPTVCPLCPLLCDGKDNNCDSQMDFSTDRDFDSDGVPQCAGDCDDDDPFVSPDEPERCNNQKDDDCDLLIDQNDPDCTDAADFPHDVILDCTICHDPGTYVFNAAIPNSKCDQCHTPFGSLKPGYPTAPDVKTHYSNFYIDPTTGVLVNIDCVECHNPMREQPNLAGIRDIIRGVPVVFPPYNGYFPPYVGICDACHTQTAYHRVDGSGLPHGGYNDCGSCHLHSEGFVTIVDCFGPHDAITDCNVCHTPDFTEPIPNIKCDQCHTATGALKGSYPAAPDVETHQGNSYSFSIDCVECHTDHCYDNGINIKLVRSTISGSFFPGSQIVFTAYSGPGSFADGSPYEENICNTCHTQTNHHQADGTAPGGQEHNTGLDCTQCHSHLPNGFFPTF